MQLLRTLLLNIKLRGVSIYFDTYYLIIQINTLFIVHDNIVFVKVN